MSETGELAVGGCCARLKGLTWTLCFCDRSSQLYRYSQDAIEGKLWHILQLRLVGRSSLNNLPPTSPRARQSHFDPFRHPQVAARSMLFRGLSIERFGEGV